MPVKQKDKKVKKPKTTRNPRVVSKQKQIKQLVNVSVQSSGGSGGGGSSMPVPQSFKPSGFGEDVKYETLVNQLVKRFGQQMSSNPPIIAPPSSEKPNPLLYRSPDLSGLSLVDKVAMETRKNPESLGIDIDEEGEQLRRVAFENQKRAEDDALASEFYTEVEGEPLYEASAVAGGGNSESTKKKRGNPGGTRGKYKKKEPLKELTSEDLFKGGDEL